MTLTSGMGQPQWPFDTDSTTTTPKISDDYYIYVERLRNRVAREIADDIDYGLEMTKRIQEDLLPVYRWLDAVLREEQNSEV